MRRHKEVRDVVLRSRGSWQEIRPERQNAKDASPLKIREVRVDGRRYIVCLNEEQRRKDAHDRQAITEALRKQLKRGARSLVGNKGYRKYLKTNADASFEIDEEKLRAEAEFDGLWVICTNMDDPAEIIASVKNGVYAVSFGGGQVDITSGKFVFGCTEAYMIENGKVTRPIKGAMLIGNGPDAMHRVTMVGNDMKLDTGIGMCGKAGQGVPVGVGQPHIRMNQMTVGGTRV